MEFRTVVCGIGPDHQAAVAADHAARLVTRAGQLTLVGVDEITVVGGAMAPGTTVVRHTGEAKQRLDEAAATIEPLHGNVRTLAVEGAPIRELLEAIDEHAADLVVVGSNEPRRLVGVVFGSTTTAMLHDAPCSVLVAREGARAGWPGSVVVGIDGSPGSLRALDAARVIAASTGASLRPMAAAADLDREALDTIRAAVPDVETVEESPVEALVDASRVADLVVVGSRGLRGLRALGSVSERVAHGAQCSVLVVRTAHP